MEIAGRGTLVSGGSRGLGAALGAELCRRGARVVLAARGEEELRSVVAEIRESGGDAHGLVADVGDAGSIHPLVGAASALVGPLDLLVHGASSLGPLPLRELMDTECEDLLRVLEVNLLGPFRLTKAVAGSMALRRTGLVLAVSSDAGVVGYPGWGAYGVSKAGLDHLMRSWAAELTDSGVRFLSVDPGEMDTRMHADAEPEADRSRLAAPAAVARLLADLIGNAEAWPSGSRIEAARLRRIA
jgi:NAD(P)-dependent dehydrogenase (short-subunit alcohol dehydrogenase family)